MMTVRDLGSIGFRCLVRWCAVLGCTGALSIAQATWTQLPVGSGIGPVTGPLVSYDVVRNVTVVFSNPQTWEFDGSTWTNRTNGPAPRNGWISYDLARGRHVVYERPQGTTPTVPTQHTWEWDGSSWTDHGLTNAPVLDVIAGMAYDPRRGAVVLFGNDQAGGPRPGTWAWDGARWTRLVLQSEGPQPMSHILTTDWVRQRVLMINLQPVSTLPGVYGTYYLDDTGWHQVAGSQSAPYRIGAAIAQDPIRDRVVMFGGNTFFGQCGTWVNETWEFDGLTWIQRSPTNSPPPIIGASAVFNWVEQSVDLFGGAAWSGGCSYSGDLVWRYATPHLASVAPAGNGCSSGLGTPALELSGQIGPWTGERYEFGLANVSPGAAAVMLTGFANQSWGGRTLPAELAFLGAPGCFLHLEPFVSYPFSVGPSGALRWSITVPSQVSFAGIGFFDQAVVVAPGANPAGIVVSNALLSTIGVK